MAGKGLTNMFDPSVLEPENSTPLYLQLANYLRDHIHAGGVKAGEALPSERDLCDRIGASRVTIRKAIDRLIAEGMLVRKQGSGTFVTNQIEAAGTFLSSFSEDAGARGAVPGAIWIMRGDVAQPTDEEGLLLELAQGEKVVRLSRVRLSSGDPLAIEHAVVPHSMLPQPGILGESLYSTLTGLGNRPQSGIQKVRASKATAAEADLLSITEGDEVLRIERLTRRADGRPVEFTRSAYRGDRYVFVTELR